MILYRLNSKINIVKIYKKMGFDGYKDLTVPEVSNASTLRHSVYKSANIDGGREYNEDLE